jgi:hypothetical protein
MRPNQTYAARVIKVQQGPEDLVPTVYLDIQVMPEQSEADLLTKWLKIVRTRGDANLTRSGRTEVRHVCLYAYQQLESLRTQMTRDDMTSRHAVLELREVITNLEGLLAYIETGKGGFSALGDRNER